MLDSPREPQLAPRHSGSRPSRCRPPQNESGRTTPLETKREKSFATDNGALYFIAPVQAVSHGRRGVDNTIESFYMSGTKPNIFLQDR